MNFQYLLLRVTVGRIFLYSQPVLKWHQPIHPEMVGYVSVKPCHDGHRWCCPSESKEFFSEFLCWCCWRRNPANQLIGSLSHHLQGLGYIPGGCLGFPPSTISFAQNASLLLKRTCQPNERWNLHWVPSQQWLRFLDFTLEKSGSDEWNVWNVWNLQMFLDVSWLRTTYCSWSLHGLRKIVVDFWVPIFKKTSKYDQSTWKYM